MQHQQKGRDKLGGVIAHAAPRCRQGRIKLLRHSHRLQKLPKERQPPMGGELLGGGFKFERENGLWHQLFHLVGEEWLSGWAPLS